MGTTNFGNQDIQWQYFDPLNSDEFDKHSQDIIPVGVYKGGSVTKNSETSVRIHPLTCMISDGTQEARIATTVSIDLAVNAGTPYIILRWEWQPLVNWFMDVLAVATPLTDDLVVCYCDYSGPSMVVRYTGRTVPKTLDNFLKPSPQPTPDLTIHVEPGYVSYGDSRIPYAGGESPSFTPPGASTRVDLLWIDSAGVLQISTGGTLSAPSHQGKIAIAEVHLYAGQTQIVDADLVDARPWINLGGGGGLSGAQGIFMLMGC